MQTSLVRKNIQFLSSTYLCYSGDTKVVVAAFGGIVYGAASTRLYRSIDGCKTWSSSLIDITPDYFSIGFINPDTGTVLMWTNLGKIYRSTDGTTFSQIDITALGTLYNPIWHGMASNGSTVVFGEYTTGSNRNLRIITSIDDGQTWNATLTRTGGDTSTDIRHFHSADYFHVEGYFVVTTGDNNAQVRWFKSVDGSTWEEISGINNQSDSQDYRTLNIQYLGAGNIEWGTDSDGVAYVCRANLSDIPGTKRRIVRLPHSVWGLRYEDGIHVCITGVSSGDTDNPLVATIHTSIDGTRWRVDKKWKLTAGQTVGGFRALRYINNFKKWCIGFLNLEKTSPFFTIIAKLK